MADLTRARRQAVASPAGALGDDLRDRAIGIFDDRERQQRNRKHEQCAERRSCKQILQPAADEHPDWYEYYCSGNELIKIGKETYFRAGDGNLMPTRPDQPPPDLTYFKRTGK